MSTVNRQPVVNRRLAGALCGWLGAAAAAQAPAPWAFFALPEPAATALAVAWRQGYDLDRSGECGASRVLAECRLERARATSPPVRASGLQVHGDVAVAFVLAEAGRWPDAVRFVQALLDDARPLDDDTIDLAVARCALAADDADWLYPGPVLAGHARRVLFAGGPFAHGVAGSAVELQRLSPARVRELLREPVARRGLGLGDLPPALRETLGAALAPSPWPAPPAANPRRDPQAPAAAIPHPRADAPYASAAFRVPAAVDRLALAVAVEAARARFVVAMPPSAKETLARAPRLSWSLLHGDPLVVAVRRGPPGAGARVPHEELDRWLTGLSVGPPSAAEVAAARAAVLAELGLPPWSPEQAEALAASAPALPGRATSLLLARIRGVDAAGVAAVTAADSARALAAVLDPPGGARGAVVPAGPAGPPVAPRRK
ncbi:MAG: hypothetical protein FJ265_15590, partial [Planctomycetes bacterium]|nr:hypothetical protein [Planctomycetota bacterium]